MANRLAFALIFVVVFCLFLVESKKVDLYKVLGVDRNASQREIQKAFHKLSLQYHPDKNKNKGAQEKFAEINNAYDILSDEQKRKNYDLYGDDKGNPGFDGGNPGEPGGYTFTSGGPGGFSFRPGEWQNMGGQGGSKSFSFSFGGPGSGSSGFGLDDIFSNFFGGGMGGSQFGGGMGGGNPFGGGMGGGSQFGGASSSGRSQRGSKYSAQNIPSVNSQLYRKEIVDSGMTWLLLAYTLNLQGLQHYQSVIEEVFTSFQGAMKVGSINCESEASLCKELGVYPRRVPRIIVHSYASGEKGSLVEYGGDLDSKFLKKFCEDNLPKFSKRIKLDNFNAAPDAGKLPKVLLLSTKKSTPVIWRALSGLYNNRFLFYDAEVQDVSDPSVRNLGVNSLPAIVGYLSNGEKQVLKSGISVKDLKSAIQELSGLLESFEKKNKKAASTKNDHIESGGNIPLLTASNFDHICGEKVPVCFIGVFKSSATRDKLQKIFQSVSQKSYSRRPSSAYGSRDSLSYGLLDASKQQSFVNALEKSGFKSSGIFLVAYKPKRGTFATSQDDITEEAVERFISSVLNGDVQFSKTKQKPILK